MAVRKHVTSQQVREGKSLCLRSRGLQPPCAAPAPKLATGGRVWARGNRPPLPLKDLVEQQDWVFFRKADLGANYSVILQ